MYRFLLRPRWLAFHLLVAVAIVAMINLGFWQLRRLDERREFNAVVEARYDAPAVPLDRLLTPTIDTTEELEELAWRPVRAAGEYLPDERLLVVNRSQNGRAGVNVVVPMQLGDGRVLLVNRGFVPFTAEIPPVPGERVDVTGRLRPSQERRFGQLSDPAEGDLTEVQRLDIDRLAAQLPGPVVPMYVDLSESDPAEPGPFPEPVAKPDLSEGSHLPYAVQWFIFSVAVAAGWVLAVRRSARTRARSASKEPDESAGVAVREPAAHRPRSPEEHAAHRGSDRAG